MNFEFEFYYRMVGIFAPTDALALTSTYPIQHGNLPRILGAEDQTNYLNNPKGPVSVTQE